jgi:phage anti-repressor protein
MLVKLIYIAGYGRSGSTLIERILGSNDQIVALGEMKDYLFIIDKPEEKCACGENVISCKFWNLIYKYFKGLDINKLRKQQKKYESFSGLKYHFLRNKGKDIENYKEFLYALYSEIFSQSGKETKYLVDSSKTARESFLRPILLNEVDNIEVKLIHLVRDGRACLYSNLRGSNRKMEKGIDAKIPWVGFRTVISWALANISAHLFKWRFGKDNYFRLKYEDFIDDPVNKLKEMEKYLDIDFYRQIEMIKQNEAIPLSHQIAGNRLRNKQNLRLSSRYKEMWREKLPLQYKMLFWIFDWPFVLMYGYK